MQQLPQALHEKKGNPKNSAGLKKTEGTSSLRLFSKLLLCSIENWPFGAAANKAIASREKFVFIVDML